MRFLAFKHAHFTAVAHYRRSLDDLGANRYGDELGRLRICERALADVLLPSKPGGGGGKRGVPEAVVRDLKVRVGGIYTCADMSAAARSPGFVAIGFHHSSYHAVHAQHDLGESGPRNKVRANREPLLSCAR
jgi:hypothetical protein